MVYSGIGKAEYSNYANQINELKGSDPITLFDKKALKSLRIG